MVFRELSDGDALHPDAVARFVNPEKPTTEKENAAPPTPAPDAPSRLDALSRPKRVHDKPPPSEDATPWKATSITSPIPPLPPSPRTPGGTRRPRPPASPGGRADALLGARDALGRAAEALAASDTAAEDDPAELAVAVEQLRQLCVRVAAAADGVATLAATIKRKRGAQSLAKSVSFSDDVVTP